MHMAEQKKRERAIASKRAPTTGTPSKRASVKRPYRMGVRQTAVDRTRESIVSAAFDLHATVGPSRTTISAIAAHAGLQRHTVYAHFPDLGSMYEACTTHGIKAMGMPDPEDWRAIASARDRLNHGVRAMVAWHRANGAALERLLFDVSQDTPPPSTPDPFEVRMRDLRAALTDGWPVDEARRPLLDAVVGHAIHFTTWRSLAIGGLDDERISVLLVGLVKGIAAGSIAPDA